MTAHQFRPVYEKLCSELKAVGLGKSDREEYLEYLRRIGQPWRGLVMGYNMVLVKPDGQQTIRKPETWLEAHQALLDIEQQHAGNRSLVGMVAGIGPGKGAGKDPDQAKALQEFVAKLPPHLKRVCFQKVNTGKCNNQGCNWDHNNQMVTEAKALVAPFWNKGGKGKGGGKTGGGGKGGANANPKAKAKSKAKVKKDKKNKGGANGTNATNTQPQAPPAAHPEGRTGTKKELCLNFLRGQCKKGDQCDHSHAKKIIGATMKALNQYKGQGKGAGGAAAAATTAVVMQPAGPPPQAGTAPAATAAGVAPQGATLMWVSQGKGNGYGPIMFGATQTARRYKGEATVCTLPGVGTIYVPEGPLGSISDIPADSWEKLKQPPEDGYQYRTWTHFVTVCLWAVETLVDTGAASSVMPEELFVGIINHAVSSGMTPEHPDWPDQKLKFPRI